METIIMVVSLLSACISLYKSIRADSKAKEAINLHTQSTLKIAELEQKIVSIQNSRVSGIYGSGNVAVGNGRDGFHVG